ncbi:MAG TPA: VCBS repeat-containing protein, partial [Candidatus Binataceae bacterium]|nr:VCBS repeat-containing protein [Candidatus Binataceae bacterium]
MAVHRSSRKSLAASWVIICTLALFGGIAGLCCGLAREDFAVGLNPIAVLTVVLTSNGLPDIVTISPRAQTLSVLLRNPGNLFQRLPDMTLPGVPRALAAADFNRDGKMDLAVAIGSNSVSIMLGNGDGTFTPASTVTTGSGPSAIVAADFNGDGNPDIAVTNRAAGTVTVALGNGAGGFGTPKTFSVGLGPDSIVTGDFNNDGKPDLAVANFASM